MQAPARQVSLVDKLVFEFTGIVSHNALALGDVDNDARGDVELAIGSTEGDLALFKFDSTSPWKTCSQLGTIVCMAIGDVRNNGKNSLVVLTVEGLCHVFDITARDTDDERPSMTQSLKANACDMILADITGDGANDLVYCCSNRQCYVYTLNDTNGQFEEKLHWRLDQQPYSIDYDSQSRELILGLASGGYCHIDQRGCSRSFDSPGSSSTTRASNGGSTDTSTSVRMPQPGTTSVSVVAGLNPPSTTAMPSKRSLVATLDGGVMLVQDHDPVWSVDLDARVFAAYKTKLTPQAGDDIVCCAWDGQTYLMDQNQSILRFDLGQRVSAFCAGQYSIASDSKVSCLVYATFSDQIYIYFNVKYTSLRSSMLLDALESERTSFASLLDDDAPLGADDLASLVRACVYTQITDRYDAYEVQLEDTLYKLESDLARK